MNSSWGLSKQVGNFHLIYSDVLELQDVIANDNCYWIVLICNVNKRAGMNRCF